MTKKRKSTKRRANPKDVYDSAGKLVGRFKTKAAKIVARVVGGTVGKPKKNPFPKNRYVTVKAKRLANGRIALYGRV